MQRKNTMQDTQLFQVEFDSEEIGQMQRE